MLYGQFRHLNFYISLVFEGALCKKKNHHRSVLAWVSSDQLFLRVHVSKWSVSNIFVKYNAPESSRKAKIATKKFTLLMGNGLYNKILCVKCFKKWNLPVIMVKLHGDSIWTSFLIVVQPPLVELTRNDPYFCTFCNLSHLSRTNGSWDIKV